MIIMGVADYYAVNFRHVFHLDRWRGVSRRADPLGGRASMGEDAGQYILDYCKLITIMRELTDQRAVCSLFRNPDPLE